MDKAIRESTRTRAERDAQKRYRYTENGKEALKRAQTKWRHKRWLERLLGREFAELMGGAKMTPYDKRKLAELKDEFKGEGICDSWLHKYI